MTAQALVHSWSRLRARPVTLGCCLLLLAVVATSLLAPILPLADPNATHLHQRLTAPARGAGWLGTDHLGRDIFARLVHGMRLSLAVAVVGVFIAASIGSTLGIVGGYYRGVIDGVLMRIVDVLMAFPYLLLALAIVAVIGPGLNNATVAVAIVNVPFFARAVRGRVLSLRRATFVDAARVCGLSDRKILFTQILPSLWPTIIVAATTSLGWMILETAGLSFLGLGAIPPTADLGGMLGQGRHLLTTAPHVSLIPGAAIFVVVTLFNVIGDGLHEMLDPLQARSAQSPKPRAPHAARSAPTARAELTAEQPVPRPPDVALQVNGLHLRVGRTRIVDDVSFSIKRGERVALVGESGCGKSVTALSIMRLLDPAVVVEAGTIDIEDVDVHTPSSSGWVRTPGARAAWIPQDATASLHPLRRVGVQLTEALTLHQGLRGRTAKQAALQLLSEVGIADEARRFHAWPHELSGGMQQRVVIAMALAGQPRLLIADEPTTALDVTTQATVMSLMTLLCEQRQTALLFITHDLAVASEVCQRVLVMRHGRIVEQGSVREITRFPRHAYTRRLLDAVPVLGAPDRLLSGQSDARNDPSNGFRRT